MGGVRPPVHVYEKPQPKPQPPQYHAQAKSDKQDLPAVWGKPQTGSNSAPVRPTKLVDIPSPDLSLPSNSLSRSITVTSSQSYAKPANSASNQQSFENKDRSAVVRAVVSVSDTSGNLL